MPLPTAPPTVALPDLAKALGHPARVAILRHLAKVNACVGTDIVEVIPLAQPTISRHLKVLRDAGLIQGTVEGNKTCFCIDPAGWAQLRQTFTTLFDEFDPDSCC